jgi:hypothetical protein
MTKCLTTVMSNDASHFTLRTSLKQQQNNTQQNVINKKINEKRPSMLLTERFQRNLEIYFILNASISIH